MSYDDGKLGTLFPTRFGTPTGSSNERQMLDKTGADGIRKSYRTLADGSVVMCETRNGFPKFTLQRKEVTEALTDIGMDSGVVDLVKSSFAWTGAQDENTADGKLYQTTFVTSYLAGAAIDADSPVVNIITPPHTGGTPETDGSIAKSFRKKTPTDYTALYQRKRVAALCPPSIFTGKTRLYVQALYGRHDALTNVSASMAATEAWARPSIFVSGIEVHTSCGVYLDPATGNHYLLSVEGATTKIYKLVATSAAEKLRPKLIDAGISVSDREKIEAFVLAYSAPATLVAALNNGVSHSESMGYGWHFNWSGTVCDIVINDVVAAPGGGNENESTHHRLTFMFSNGVFSVEPSVVEGPKRWKSYRHNHVIASPIWYQMLGLEKFGAHQGPSPYGNAPFYVFYDRDEIKVCRYASSTASVQKKIDVRTPEYYNPGNYFRFGGDAVHYRVSYAWTGVNVSITCGDTAVSYISGSYTSSDFSSPAVEFDPSSMTVAPGSYWTTAIEAKTGYPTGITTYPISTEFGTIQAYSGNGGVSDATYATEQLGPFSEYRQSSIWTISQPIEETSLTESSQISTGFIAVIPFMDAEACCLLGTKTTYTTQNGVTRTGGGEFWGVYATYEDATARGYYSIAGTMSNYGVEVDISNRVLDPVTETSTVLVCSGGVFQGISFPSAGSFFSDQMDIVSQTFSTRSSASGGAVVSEPMSVAYGVAFVPTPFTFVGWA